jgi:hypothetical protein
VTVTETGIAIEIGKGIGKGTEIWTGIGIGIGRRIRTSWKVWSGLRVGWGGLGIDGLLRLVFDLVFSVFRIGQGSWAGGGRKGLKGWSESSTTRRGKNHGKRVYRIGRKAIRRFDMEKDNSRWTCKVDRMISIQPLGGRILRGVLFRILASNPYPHLTCFITITILSSMN